MTSAQAAQVVARARLRQLALRGCLNGELQQSQLQAVAKLTPEAARLLQQVFERLGLTARSYHRVLRVALTIADLEAADVIAPAHVAEAVQLRRVAASFRSAPGPAR
jgi:magnesium chelatase family protein